MKGFAPCRRPLKLEDSMIGRFDDSMDYDA